MHKNDESIENDLFLENKSYAYLVYHNCETIVNNIMQLCTNMYIQGWFIQAFMIQFDKYLNLFGG